MGSRRIRHRCADWRSVVAAGLLLLLSGLQLLPRVWLWLWLRLSGLQLRLRLSGLLLRRLLPALLRRGILGGPFAPARAGGGSPPLFLGFEKYSALTFPCPKFFRPQRRAYCPIARA